jgi:hypothetical protein
MLLFGLVGLKMNLSERGKKLHRFPVQTSIATHTFMTFGESNHQCSILI